MKHRQDNHHGPWSIVLAGGDGLRTRPFIKRWLGYPRPKQYCAFVGTRSVFQHTVDRADRVTSSERRVTLVADWHREEALGQLRGRPPGTLLLQPENRGTAAGIFLPLTHVQAEDPDATVIIFPSDHFIHPEDLFLEQVTDALRAVEVLPGRLLLLGIEPDVAEVDYGWILPGPAQSEDRGMELHNVRRFAEKPSLEEVEEIIGAGGLWNTLIVAGKVKTFWKLGWHCVPEMMPLFHWLGQAIGTPREREVAEVIYKMMPVRSFSRHVLQRVPEQLTVMPLRGVLWSDWGRPARIAETLKAIGKEPAFPEEHVLAS